MKEPLEYTVTSADMIRKAKAWMVERHGDPRQLAPEQSDKWLEKLGLLYDFITDKFPE